MISDELVDTVLASIAEIAAKEAVDKDALLTKICEHVLPSTTTTRSNKKRKIEHVRRQ